MFDGADLNVLDATVWLPRLDPDRQLRRRHQPMLPRPHLTGQWNSRFPPHPQLGSTPVAMRCEKTEIGYSAIISFACGLMLVKTVHTA
jgi:hypothetical protein